MKKAVLILLVVLLAAALVQVVNARPLDGPTLTITVTPYPTPNVTHTPPAATPLWIWYPPVPNVCHYPQPCK